MIHKRNTPFLIFYVFASMLAVMLFTLYLYGLANSETSWWLDLFQLTVLKIPLIVFFLITSLVLTGFAFGVVYLFNRSIYAKIEEQLQLLVLGKYNQYTPPVSDETHYGSLINFDINRIRLKLSQMSQELQELNELPQMVVGESKEEIIKEERHRIARELHDSVSQQLFAATMLLSTLNEIVDELETPVVIETQLQTITHIIDQSQSEMRALLLHLRPINLEHKTLKQGIESLLKELKTKINIELSWKIEDVKLPNAMEDHLFRISQELISNTLRHAKANSLEVYLKETNGMILFRMIDDGVGFDAQIEKIGSYGLKNSALGSVAEISNWMMNSLREFAAPGRPLTMISRSSATPPFSTCRGEPVGFTCQPNTELLRNGPP